MARIAIIENSPLLARYFRHFLEAEGVAHETFSVWRGASFPDGGFDAYIMTGDFHNVTDGLKAYHERELEFLSKVRDEKIFASCFSHQLIAHQHGGKVARRAARLIGWEHLRISEGHPALVGMSEFSAICMNTDEVSEPPADARWIAASENCKYQMLAYDENILTCQVHPELMPGRNRLTINLTAFLLTKGPTAAYRDFRRTRAIAGDSDSEKFMRGVIRWLVS
ncbi:MAG: hypothetical protein JJE48_09220 [Actinobacteria bacterium]|nr:hypothetical protein [Actinomycetota bacterium]